MEVKQAEKNHVFLQNKMVDKYFSTNLSGRPKSYLVT